MAEPIILYAPSRGKTLTTYAPTQAKQLIEAGWTLSPPPAKEPARPGPATPTPDSPQRRLTPIPDDFPAAQELRRAGLETLEAVTQHRRLTAIRGIGRTTERKIREALAGRTEK